MTPKDIINFVNHYDLSFFYLEHELKWELDESEVVDEKGKELLKQFGEFEIVHEYDNVEDDKRKSKSIILHFVTLGFYIEEKTYFVWGNENGREYFLVEPIANLAYGYPKKIS